MINKKTRQAKAGSSKSGLQQFCDRVLGLFLLRAGETRCSKIMTTKNLAYKVTYSAETVFAVSSIFTRHLSRHGTKRLADFYRTARITVVNHLLNGQATTRRNTSITGIPNNNDKGADLDATCPMDARTLHFSDFPNSCFTLQYQAQVK